MRDLEDDLGGRYADREQYTVSWDGDAPKGRQWVVTKSTVGRKGSTRLVSRHRTKKAAKAAARRQMGPGDGGVALTKGMTNSEPL